MKTHTRLPVILIALIIGLLLPAIPATAVPPSKSFTCPGVDTATIVYTNTVSIKVDPIDHRTYVRTKHGDKLVGIGISLKDYLAVEYRFKKILCIIPVEHHQGATVVSSPAYRIFYTD